MSHDWTHLFFLVMVVFPSKDYVYCVYFDHLSVLYIVTQFTHLQILQIREGISASISVLII